MTTTYRDCPHPHCDGEWAFELDEYEAPDYEVGIMGPAFWFVLDLKWSCEHAAALSDQERADIEQKVSEEYTLSGAWGDDE